MIVFAADKGRCVSRQREPRPVKPQFWTRVAEWSAIILVMVGLSVPVGRASPVRLPNPILFVSQVPIPRELNSSVSNTFLSVVTLFGNHLGDTAHAARGGDLWLLATNGSLVNLTRAAGYGASGAQAAVGISVRDPSVHWSGTKALFSMVVGAPTGPTSSSTFYWQLYEVTNLDALVANKNTTPAIVPVPNQPANCNNVSPCYSPDGRIIFTSDRPFNDQPYLYPQRDEYKGAPSVTGTYSLDPATGEVRLLEHLPSGAFNPFVDSFGRLIITRWDHLVQDSNATGDRLGRSTNGPITFSAELPTASVLPANPLEQFPEPVDFDTAYAAQLGVNVNGFNLFLPWALDPDGGNEELINHVGRHELIPTLQQSFPNDPNLVSFTNFANRALYGITTPNTNYFNSFLQITEDPRTNGLYYGVDAQDISIFGGTHSGGQILTLNGALNLNATGMVINYLTPKSGANGPNALGVFRNPLPMSDGTLVAAFTPTPRTLNFGFDTNIGSAAFPVSLYHFRLMTLTNLGPSWTTNAFLTSGMTNAAMYWDGSTLVTYTGQLWELQPVEVRSRPMPAAMHTAVASVEQQVFAEEGVDLTTFQADLVARGLALSVSRNVTARDSADKQQPFNLHVPGGAQTLGTNSGPIYNITHLQFLQADYLRGYTFGTANAQPGRRVLATPMHDAAAFNPPSHVPTPPIGGSELAPDGSQATLVPAGRALTWQLTGSTNESVVKERYWLTFRPGEVRTCANCHGINVHDQAGNPPPANPPLALRQLLRFWRTNAANSYQLVVNNSSGSGRFGAGTILTLSADAAPAGMAFSQWLGAGISNPTSPTTVFVMPATNVTLSAVYTPLAAPTITAWTFPSPTTLSLSAQAVPNQPWVLQTSTNLVDWAGFGTNGSNPSGQLQFLVPVSPTIPQQFFRLRSP